MSQLTNEKLIEIATYLQLKFPPGTLLALCYALPVEGKDEEFEPHCLSNMGDASELLRDMAEEQEKKAKQATNN